MSNASLGPPIKKELNNGILSFVHAMPMKELTSDNASSFSLGRYLFSRINAPVAYNNVITNKTIQRQAHGLNNNQVIITGPNTTLQKRWIGGNHDASQIIANRRNRAIGQSINPTYTPQSFGSQNDRNDQRRAIQRTRSQGSVVPTKNTHKYLNSPAFSLY
jgi:hypothetical protein